MKKPIIVNENGDLTVFSTEKELSEYLEPIDVRNGEYVAYSADGSLLSLKIDGEDHDSKFIGTTKKEWVVLDAQIGPDKSSELKTEIKEYLEKIEAIDPQKDLELDQLVVKLCEANGKPRLNLK